MLARVYGLARGDAFMQTVTFGKRKTPPAIVDAAPAEAPALASAGEAPQANETVGASGRTHYFLQQSNLVSLKLLEREIAESLLAGAEEITIVLSSPGGLLLPMLEFYRSLKSLPVKIKTHAAGPVASAATILFLAGDERSADPRATFMFHPVSVTMNTAADAYQALRIERQRLLFEMTLHNIYKERTRLSNPTIERFGREELVFNCEMAIEHGIIDRIESREATPAPLSNRPSPPASASAAAPAFASERPCAAPRPA
jgi:ATP-dependent protease ClpP protease subunit